jgi:phosphatidylglycerol:prolipoprotein diacylglycerol transferase
MIWNISPELFSLGPLHVRWYGALFALAFVCAYRMLKKMYAQDGYGFQKVDSLLWYMMISTVVGARLGHCLFYQPEIYLADPLRIFKVWEGGLASHGAFVGIMVGIYLYTRRNKEYSPLQVMDRVVIGVALSGFFIRLGNFFNSEIIGKPTTLPWAVTFARDDQIPRHPAQLYESFFYLVIFTVLYRMYWKTNARLKKGLIFGSGLIGIFSARFILEFFKENQELFENNWPINMGQILSIPLIFIGLYFVLTSNRRKVAVPLRTSVAKKSKR